MNNQKRCIASQIICDLMDAGEIEQIRLLMLHAIAAMKRLDHDECGAELTAAIERNRKP